MRVALATTRLALLTGILTTTFVLPAEAAWEFLPRAEVRAESNDNLRLAPDNTLDIENASRTRLEARARLTNFNERGNIYFEPRIRSDSYGETENSDLEGTDIFLRGRGEYRWETLALGFRSDYDKQDVRDAEITGATPEDPDIDDPIDPDTGVLSVIEQDRERTVFTPYAEVQVSERSALLFEARLMDVSYSAAQLTNRSNFTDTEFSAGIVRRVDARNEVSARVYSSQYEAETNFNTTETVGVQGNFTRPLGRGWTFDLTAGVNRSDYSFVNEQNQVVVNADTSFTYGLGFRQRTERSSLNIDLLRRNNPNSNGFLTLRDEVRVYLRRAMSERLTGGLAVRTYRTQTLDDVVQNDQRDYMRVELELQWALNQRMSINGGYAFTTQEFQAATRDDATSNMLFVGFQYQGIARQ